MINKMKKSKDFYKNIIKISISYYIMTITRKEIIQEKYILLKTQLERYIDDNLFPSVDDYSINDIVYYLNLYFPKGNEHLYSDTVERLMKNKNIVLDDNDFSDFVNLIIDFINFLNNI